MKTKTYVGLDVHRKLVVATAMDPLGKRIRQSSFGPSPKELRRFLIRLPKPTRVVLEACHVWERYYEAALSTGAEVVVSHPSRTRMIAEASLKTDKVDSATLANLLRLDSLPLTYIPPPEIRLLRKIYLERDFYTRARIALLRHTYARLAEYGIDYQKALLQHRPQREKLRQHSIPAIDRALDSIDDLDRTLKGLNAEVHSAFLSSPDAQLLKTIPGIGEVMAVGIAGYLCPIDRFPNVDKLTSYVGLCPTTHQSGDSLYYGQLKPDVSRRLRSLLVAASWTHRVSAPKSDVSKFAHRMIRRKGRMRATVASAHKFLRLVHAILKQRRPYLPHAPERPVPKQAVRVSRKRSAAVSRVKRASPGSPVAGSRARRRTKTALNPRKPRPTAMR